MKQNNESNIVSIDSIDAYNKLYGLTTDHPLVTVLDLKKATRSVNHVRMDYGVYVLYLKNGVNCTLMYGRQPYDYHEGTIVSFRPGQLIGVEMDKEEVAPDVIGLMFHPDLIFGTPLAARIDGYRFFDYSQREALHLSAEERAIFMECLQRIKKEIERPVDRHTAEIVASHIQVLLDYLTRFYERQFITRHKVNSDVLSRFDAALKEYYSSGKAVDGIPSVAYFADIVNLTPGYFGDLIKKETGKTAQELIALRVTEEARKRLTETSDDISIIAYDLGFQYPQHFTRMFRKQTGKSPREYRLSYTMTPLPGGHRR